MVKVNFIFSYLGLSSSGSDDQFNESVVNRNLTPLRARNGVQRNDSYYVAVNKSQSPGGQFYSPLRPRPFHRPSPLAVGNGRTQFPGPITPARTSTPVDNRVINPPINFPAGRPISTVAMPTPPLESTDDRPSSPSQASPKALPPQPPPRWDSERDTTKLNYGAPSGLQLRLKMPDGQNSPERGATPTTPPPPPSQFSNQSPTRELPPSYDQAVSRLGRSPHPSVSSEPTTPVKEQRKSWSEDVNGETPIIRPPSPFSSEDDNPFRRDGFGRLSMSEKRGRAALDARQSEFFMKRDQERSEGENLENREHLKLYFVRIVSSS